MPLDVISFLSSLLRDCVYQLAAYVVQKGHKVTRATHVVAFDEAEA